MFDRTEIRLSGVDLDAGQQSRGLIVLEHGGLLHHILARQIVAALPEYLDECFGSGVAIDSGGVILASGAGVLVGKGTPVPGATLLLPGRVTGVLQKRGRADVSRILRAGRLHDRFLARSPLV